MYRVIAIIGSIVAYPIVIYTLGLTFGSNVWISGVFCLLYNLQMAIVIAGLTAKEKKQEG